MKKVADRTEIFIPKPGVKINDERLISIKSFNIIRSEKVSYQYLIELRLPHDGELNPNKMTTEDNVVLVEFNFSKHTEVYRGKWANYMIKWEDGSDPLLVLFFMGTKLQ